MDDERDGSHHRSAYDLLKDFGGAVAAVVGMILTAKSASTLRLFFVLALFFGALGLGPRVAAGVRKRRAHSRDEKFARNEWTRFRQFVREFGAFVDTRTNDTLHRIIREASTPARAGLDQRFEATPIEFWNSLWYFFDQRVGRTRPGFNELRALIQEFDNFVGQYHNYCVAPIFDRLPAEIRSQLSDDDKRRLAGFQQRHHTFINAYAQFGRSLADSHPALEHLPRYQSTSNPL